MRCDRQEERRHLPGIIARCPSRRPDAPHPPPPRPPDQPDRRRRGRRTPGLGAQGTARKRPRCRRHGRTDRPRGRRRQADPHRRRRLRHPAGRTGAGADPPRHLEDRLAGRPRTGRHDGLSRRGAGLDRRRRPRHVDQPRAGRRPRLAPRRASPAAPGAGRAGRRHGGRDARPLLQHAGPPEIPEERGHRFAHCAEVVKRIALAWPDVAITLTHNGRGDPAARADAAAAPRRSRRRLSDRRARSRPVPGRCASPACRAAGTCPSPQRRPVLLRQRPLRARQGGRPRHARGLRRTCCTAAATRPTACSSNSTRRRSTSMCIRKTEVRFRDSRAVHQFVHHAVNKALVATRRLAPGTDGSAAGDIPTPAIRTRTPRPSHSRRPVRNRCSSANPPSRPTPASPAAARPPAAAATASYVRRRPAPTPACPTARAPLLGYAVAQLHGVTSWPRTPRAWSWSTCTPPTSASSTRS